jgi:hypothetical protein
MLCDMEVFIVRMWPDPGSFRGRVEHVRSGRGEVFRDQEAMCAFLARTVAGTGLDDRVVPTVEVGE